MFSYLYHDEVQERKKKVCCVRVSQILMEREVRRGEQGRENICTFQQNKNDHLYVNYVQMLLAFVSNLSYGQRSAACSMRQSHSLIILIRILLSRCVFFRIDWPFFGIVALCFDSDTAAASKYAQIFNGNILLYYHFQLHAVTNTPNLSSDFSSLFCRSRNNHNGTAIV